MPAEWERHEATWLVWPHCISDWPKKFAPIPWVYAEIVNRLVRGECVRILVSSQAHKVKAQHVLSRAGIQERDGIEFLPFPTDRGWSRDMGPIFISRSRPKPEIAIARFRFDAWAKYSNWRKDDRVPVLAADTFNMRLFPIERQGRGVVLEGGAIDVNGTGSVLVTEECLLDAECQVRNPGIPRREIEEVLGDALGATNVLWLGKGILGDDTHGHIDDICRFVNQKTVVLCREEDPTDANYKALEENRERLHGMRLEDGGKVEVVFLPMPEPRFFDGMRLPASYANFYIGNSVVLVPTFNDPHDRTALGVLTELFTDRTVIGIHSADLVWGLGTLHCLTQQQPAL